MAKRLARSNQWIEVSAFRHVSLLFMKVWLTLVVTPKPNHSRYCLLRGAVYRGPCCFLCLVRPKLVK